MRRPSRRNHHDGYHAPSDPLGVYLPPLSKWRFERDKYGPTETSWIHPRLGWTFMVRHARGFYAARVYSDRNIVLLAKNSTSERGANRMLHEWYAKQMTARSNPKRKLPAVIDRCVAHVAPRLKRGPRESLSGAIAICTASAQKRGVLKRGTRTLTAKGRTAERSATHRAGYHEDVRAVKRMARKARLSRRKAPKRPRAKRR